MRLRNLKNSKDILNSSNYYVTEPLKYKNKWNKLFNNNNPIYLEIGMGKGQFIINNALQNPNINYIGIDKYDTLIAKAINKTPKELNNLKYIKFDAFNINDIFSKEISLLYLNFSDPWPKDRHIKRRLTSEIFLNIYDKILKNNRIILKTDNRKFFEYSIKSLNNGGYKINNISLDLHKEKDASNINTEYEDKFILKGNVIYKIDCEK